MTTKLRKSARITAVAALVMGVVPFAHADGVRTETNLAGFSVDVQASPIMVLLDDPRAAIPRPTGTAVIEGDPNFTLASVSTGPNARAVASTVWPGNLFGEGLPAIDPRIPDYPLKAESRYPDQPYTAQGIDGGSLTSSSALGLDAFAQADATPTNKPGQLTIGNVTSTSAANVTEKDVAIGTASSAVHDVSVLGGLIHIGGVTTRLTTTADGTKVTSTGTTTVTGLTVAGQSFSIDDTGLHAGPQSSPLPTLATPQQLQDALGISISGLTQTNARYGSGISRTASGLVIRVDTVVLKRALEPVIGALRPTYADLVNTPSPGGGPLIPTDQQGNFYYLLNATPSLTFVFGAASTTSAATLPIEFDFDFPAPPTFSGGPSTGTGQLPTGIAPAAPTLGLAPTGTDPVAVAPVVGQQGATTPVAAFKDTRFKGIGAGLLLGALIASGLAGWGLMRFLGLAGGVLGFGCRLGAPTTVPDLRSVTA